MGGGEGGGGVGGGEVWSLQNIEWGSPYQSNFGAIKDA